MNMRPVQAVALGIMLIIAPSLLIDLWHFTSRELEYWKFRRLISGDLDHCLRPEWTSTECAELTARLIKKRGR